MATKTEPTPTATVRNALDTARAELKALVERGIDLAEKRSKAMFRFARTLAKRLGGARKLKRKS
jgi:hypothetical protein